MPNRVCIHCGKRLTFLEKLSGDGKFCSAAHRKAYQEELERLALESLSQSEQTTRRRRSDADATHSSAVPDSFLPKLEPIPAPPAEPEIPVPPAVDFRFSQPTPRPPASTRKRKTFGVVIRIGMLVPERTPGVRAQERLPLCSSVPVGVAGQRAAGTPAPIDPGMPALSPGPAWPHHGSTNFAEARLALAGGLRLGMHAAGPENAVITPVIRRGRGHTGSVSVWLASHSFVVGRGLIPQEAPAVRVPVSPRDMDVPWTPGCPTPLGTLFAAMPCNEPRSCGRVGMPAPGLARWPWTAALGAGGHQAHPGWIRAASYAGAGRLAEVGGDISGRTRFGVGFVPHGTPVPPSRIVPIRASGNEIARALQPAARELASVPAWSLPNLESAVVGACAIAHIPAEDRLLGLVGVRPVPIRTSVLPVPEAADPWPAAAACEHTADFVCASPAMGGLGYLALRTIVPARSERRSVAEPACWVVRSCALPTPEIPDGAGRLIANDVPLRMERLARIRARAGSGLQQRTIAAHPVSPVARPDLEIRPSPLPTASICVLADQVGLSPVSGLCGGPAPAFASPRYQTGMVDRARRTAPTRRIHPGADSASEAVCADPDTEPSTPAVPGTVTFEPEMPEATRELALWAKAMGRIHARSESGLAAREIAASTAKASATADPDARPSGGSSESIRHLAGRVALTAPAAAAPREPATVLPVPVPPRAAVQTGQPAELRQPKLEAAIAGSVAVPKPRSAAALETDPQAPIPAPPATGIATARFVGHLREYPEPWPAPSVSIVVDPSTGGKPAMAPADALPGEVPLCIAVAPENACRKVLDCGPAPLAVRPQRGSTAGAVQAAVPLPAACPAALCTEARKPVEPGLRSLGHAVRVAIPRAASMVGEFRTTAERLAVLQVALPENAACSRGTSCLPLCAGIALALPQPAGAGSPAAIEAAAQTAPLKAQFPARATRFRAAPAGVGAIRVPIDAARPEGAGTVDPQPAAALARIRCGEHQVAARSRKAPGLAPFRRVEIPIDPAPWGPPALTRPSPQDCVDLNAAVPFGNPWITESAAPLARPIGSPWAAELTCECWPGPEQPLEFRRNEPSDGGIFVPQIRSNTLRPKILLLPGPPGATPASESAASANPVISIADLRDHVGAARERARTGTRKG